MTLPWPTPRSRLAVAVGRERITAVEFANGWCAPAIRRVASRPIQALAENGAAWPDLAAALEEFVDGTHGEARRPVDVALLRPLCWAKMLRLPPVKRRDLLPLLEENLSRYFPVTGPTVVGVRAAGRWGTDGGDGGRRVVASCAPRHVVDAVRGAVETAGLQPGRMAAGPWAELEARLRLGSAPDEEPGALFLGSGPTAEVAVLQGRRPRMLCPVPPGDEGRGAGARLRPLVESGALPSMEDERFADVPLTVSEARGTGRGWKLSSTSTGEDVVPLGPPATAALGVGHLPADGPFLERPEDRRRRKKKERWHTLAFAGAALLLLCAAGFVHTLGLQRELRAVAEARAAIRPAVERTLQQRKDARFLADLVEAFNRVERSRPLWSETLPALALHLPESFHLTSFVHDSSGSLLSVAGPDSAGVVASALEQAGEVEQVTGGGDRDAGGAASSLTVEWSAGGSHADAGADEDRTREGVGGP